MFLGAHILQHIGDRAVGGCCAVLTAGAGAVAAAAAAAAERDHASAVGQHERFAAGQTDGAHRLRTPDGAAMCVDALTAGPVLWTLLWAILRRLLFVR